MAWYTAAVWSWFRGLLGERIAPSPRAGRALLSLGREEHQGFFGSHGGLSVLNADLAMAWAESGGADGATRTDRLKALVALWLDRVRDELKRDYRRWRHADVEGLAPLEGNIAPRLAAIGDAASRRVPHYLRGLVEGRDAGPVALVALAGQKDYYTFIDPFQPREGEFATSGGVYIGGAPLPIIAMPIDGAKFAMEWVVAHEMTHHVLADLNLPVWIEEGLTQMMEEAVGGKPYASLTLNDIRDHREYWDERSLERYFAGGSFSHAHGPEQRLAYQLSEAIVRTQMADRPKMFLRFMREACGTEDGREAARSVLGCELRALGGALVN